MIQINQLTIGGKMNQYNLKYKWTTSRARDTYGYNICTLLVDGVKKGRCNGGGYDMQGTSLGNWIENQFKDELLKLNNEFSGLTFHDPNWKVSEEIIKKEEEGKSLGLERYQDFYKQSSKVPTSTHTIPQINGAVGINSVERILNAIGFQYKCIDYKSGVYVVEPLKEVA
jgi:hypothetical protein